MSRVVARLHDVSGIPLLRHHPVAHPITHHPTNRVVPNHELFLKERRAVVVLEKQLISIEIFWLCDFTVFDVECWSSDFWKLKYNVKYLSFYWVSRLITNRSRFVGAASFSQLNCFLKEILIISSAFKPSSMVNWSSPDNFNANGSPFETLVIRTTVLKSRMFL